MPWRTHCTCIFLLVIQIFQRNVFRSIQRLLISQERISKVHCDKILRIKHFGHQPQFSLFYIIFLSPVINLMANWEQSTNENNKTVQSKEFISCSVDANKKHKQWICQLWTSATMTICVGMKEQQGIAYSTSSTSMSCIPIEPIGVFLPKES